MSAPDLGSLLATAREMQSRLAAVQRDLANRRIEGSAGGGMVRATVDGQLRVHAIAIEPSMLATQDATMLGDLCAAAVNAAIANAQRVAAAEIEKASGGLGGGVGGLLGKLFGGGA